MRITRFEASNILRINAVEISPSGGVVVIGGRNAQGKTSILNSVMAVIGGAKKRPAHLLKQGAKKGEIVLEIGEGDKALVATLRVTESGETLTLSTKAGTKYSSPQSILDGLFSGMTFDPLAFLRMKPEEQLQTLRRLVGIDFSELDAERDRIFSERTETNRQAKEAKTHMDSMQYYGDAPEKEDSIADLNKQLEGANATNAANQKVRDSMVTLDQAGRNKKADLEMTNAEVMRLTDALEVAKKKADSLVDELDVLRDQRGELKDQIAELVDTETAPIVAKMEGIEVSNRKVRNNAQYKSWDAQFQERTEAADQATIQLEEIGNKKRRILSETKFPVAGLSLEDEVTFNGVVFSQSSGAEQIIVSTAIGAALSGKLRVMLVREGSLLDEDSMKLLCAEAEKHGVQLWVETANRLHEPTVVIEDGRILENKA